MFANTEQINKEDSNLRDHSCMLMKLREREEVVKSMQACQLRWQQ